MTSPGTSPGNDLGTGPRVRDPFPRWRRVFAGRDDQVREVRRWLTGLLPWAPERDDVIVVAVELVTNAIRHTASGRGGLVMVEVTWCGPVLRVAVADGGAPDGPRLPARRAWLLAAPDGPAGLAECGRGLHLVRALATSTGVCGDPRGRLVWADIGWAGPGPAGTPLPPPPRAGRHRSVPGQVRREAGDPGRGHAGRTLAVLPGTWAAAAGAGA
jgi:anti-sigma regulatory factor (Ser/Thr protein kinase)